MVVALGAAGGGGQPDVAEIAHPVGLVDGDVLVGLGTPFLGGLEQAVVAGGDLLAVTRLGDEVARDVLDHEAVVGKVLVEGVDDVFTIGGDFHEVVTVVADGVGEADEVQPVDGHTFTEALVLEQAVDETLVGLGRRVVEKELGLFRIGGHPDQVEEQPAQKGNLVRLGGKGELFAGKGILEESVDGMSGGPLGGQVVPGNGAEGPVFLVFASLGNPGLDDLPLFGSENLARLGRGHDFLLVGAVDAQEQLAFSGLAGHESGVAPEVPVGPFLNIQPELGLPGALVGAVAMKAVLGKEGPDVAGEVHGGFCQKGEKRQQEDPGVKKKGLVHS